MAKRPDLIAVICVVILSCMAGFAKKTQLKLKTSTKQTAGYVKSSGGNRTKGAADNRRAQPLEADSILFSEVSPQIGYSGYDKPYSSRKESFLITNSSGQHISGVEVRIVYKDMEGRMLNSRDEMILTEIPPGETRHVSINSFDKQSTFYYINSKSPKTGSQPFEIGITTLRVFVPL